MPEKSSTGETNVDGVGILTYQRALDLARNAEGELDPNVSQYLEKAVDDIWANINSQPDSYVLSKDEFAVFNFYAQRFEGEPLAQQAIDRKYPAETAPPTSRVAIPSQFKAAEGQEARCGLVTDSPSAIKSGVWVFGYMKREGYDVETPPDFHRLFGHFGASEELQDSSQRWAASKDLGIKEGV